LIPTCVTQTQTSPSTLQPFPDKENTDIGKGMRRSGKSVLHSRWRIGWSAVQDSQGKAESGHIHVAIDGDRRAETGAGSAVADVAKRAQGRAAWYGAVRSGFGQLARHGSMAIWTYWRHHWRIYRNEEGTKLDVRGVRRKKIGGSQLRFSRIGANEAGSYSELQSGDGLWKGRNDPLAYKRVKKRRREGGKGSKNILTCFFGGIVRLWDASAQRPAFPY